MAVYTNKKGLTMDFKLVSNFTEAAKKSFS